MELDITGRHFHVSDPLKAHIQEKMSKIDKYSLKIEQSHVVLEVQKINCISEITVNGKNLRLTAKNEAGDMYAAFDGSFTNIQLQLSRQHDKIKDHKGRRYEVKGEEIKDEDNDE